MNLDTFMKEWSSGVEPDYRHEIRSWMHTTYTEPIAFWHELFSQTPKTSVLMQSYDFYSDCITAHVGKERVAFTLDGTSWSYDQISELVSIQEAHWKTEYQATSGKTVALVLPYGIDYLVALMTALKLGLIVSIIPPQDRFFSEKRIDDKPDFVINKLEPLEKTYKPSTDSHAYQAGETVQKHYTLNGPLLLEATRSYLHPLRDGTLVLQLKPKTRFARPSFSMLHEEPCVTLMALLSGAEIVYFPDDQFKTNLDVISIPPHLLPALIRTPLLSKCKPKLILRTPLYGNDHSWRAFSHLNEIQKIPCSQLVIDKTQGGITLFSQPRPIDVVTFLHPSLGSPWKLLKIGGKGQESTEGFGYFSLQPSLIISQVGDAWCISGTEIPLKEGEPYPTQLVQESAKKLEFVQTCLIVAERDPHHYYSKQFTLIVFVAPEHHLTLEQNKAEWRQNIQDQIAKDVGRAFVPDQTLFYSLYPKLVKGAPSRPWVERQHKNGALAMKQNRSIYHTLNKFKQSIYEKVAYNGRHETT